MPAALGTAPWRILQWLRFPAWKWDYLVTRASKLHRGVPEEDRGAIGEVNQIWDTYRWLGAPQRRLVGSAIWAVLFLGICHGLSCLFGLPLPPIRGAGMLLVDQVMILVSSFALVWITFFVVDAVMLCELFCRQLAGRQTTWEKSFAEKYAGPRKVLPEDIAYLLDIRFIAKHTEAIQGLILLPFTVLTVQLLSRSALFDHFEWPFVIIAIILALFAYAMMTVIVLRGSAENARNRALRHLRVVFATADSTQAPQIQHVIEDIERMRRGAFAPFSQHPVIGAILIPLSGAGTISLIEYFLQY